MKQFRERELLLGSCLHLLGARWRSEESAEGSLGNLTLLSCFLSSSSRLKGHHGRPQHAANLEYLLLLITIKLYISQTLLVYQCLLSTYAASRCHYLAEIAQAIQNLVVSLDLAELFALHNHLSLQRVRRAQRPCTSELLDPVKWQHHLEARIQSAV